jgi:hypothetical protein
MPGTGSPPEATGQEKTEGRARRSSPHHNIGDKRMQEIKPLLTLCHDDEVSGTTIYTNGAKAYWTEGRSSEAYLINADGTKERVGTYNHGDHWMWTAEEHGPQHMRSMTPAEQQEWEDARENWYNEE